MVCMVTRVRVGLGFLHISFHWETPVVCCFGRAECVRLFLLVSSVHRGRGESRPTLLEVNFRKKKIQPHPDVSDGPIAAEVH